MSMAATTCSCGSSLKNRSGPSWRGPGRVATAVSVLLAANAVQAEIRVVTTTPALEDITRNVGGDYVSVESVMRGPEDVHNVAPRPSHMMRLRRADLFVHAGLDAELWAPLLVKGARNAKLLAGQPGNVDVSRGIVLKEVPTGGSLTRALGDIHAYGNTHYALDPLNGLVIARTITDALKRTDPAHASEFEQNYALYATRLRQLVDELVVAMRPYEGTPVVTYHRAWTYFLDRFGLVSVGEVEPKPGIAPGPQHLSDCVSRMKAAGAMVVIVETYNDRHSGERVAERVGGAAVVLAQEVRAVPEVESYEQLFRFNVDKMIEAFEKVGVEPKMPLPDE